MSRKAKEIEHNLPTLADVATRAGVSTATVSRCLNSPGQVQEHTRLRVMTAVQELGYSPNFGARALAARRTNTIGAIIPTMENAIFARAIQAFQEELHASGVTLLIASSSYSPEIEEEQIRALVARGADALLLIGHDRSPEVYQFLESRGVPVLISWVYDPALARLSIGFDNRLAMAGLAAEVLQLGHRNIGIISAECAGNDRARARVDGVHDAMRAQGLDPSMAHLIETHYSIENGGKALWHMMQHDPRPTAVICANDVLAVGAVQMARRLGLRVPDDISITGFDDIELARVVEPPLTTVHVPHREMGRQAARLLVDMVAGAPARESVRLETTLQIRGTLAAPPA
ncbi:MAG: LacI family DNA-binding transcriptional regulator [Roseovarius sp.]|nr:LacI family DNA-binding transcriptional regulator [Roseovarius sp.]